MELKPRLGAREVGACTLERLIDSIDEMSQAAFEHNGGRRMCLEGYCGLAMPALAFLAALPRQADLKFDVACIMVAPVDGRQCTMIYESLANTPKSMLWASSVLSEILGVVPGNGLQQSLDVPLNTLFSKSAWGRFAVGWKRKAYAGVKSVADLDARMRRELAGAYWISPENSQEHSLPSDIARFTTSLWLNGLEDDLRLPYAHRGQPLCLKTILEQTKIQLVGFYGGRDPVVPESTADVLKRGLGDRYTHIVHPGAGHISYVLSPEVWDPGHPKALDPNPIDVIVELRRKVQERRTPDTPGQGSDRGAAR
jgi:pimeloyl-ACP methyl ester carboxylesterase